MWLGWVNGFGIYRGDGYQLALLPINALKPHEMVIEERVRRLIEDLLRTWILRRPILVDDSTYIVLDGHHRLEALRRIGARRIVAVLIDYDSEQVEVSSWRLDVHVDKDTVRMAGLTGKLLPPRTSRHITRFHIPELYIRIHDLI